MSGYWTALARAADRPVADGTVAAPRALLPFEDEAGSGEDGFAELEPDRTPPPPRRAEAPVANAPVEAAPRPHSDSPPAAPIPPMPERAAEPHCHAEPAPSLAPSPVANTSPEPAMPSAQSSEPVAASPTVSAAPAVLATPAPAIIPADEPAAPLSTGQPVSQAAPAPPAGPAPAPPEPPAAQARPAEPPPAAQAVPAVTLTGLAEQLAARAEDARGAEPAPIVVTIDRLDIRLGDAPAPPASAPRRERPAPVVPLEEFLRQPGGRR